MLTSAYASPTPPQPIHLLGLVIVDDVPTTWRIVGALTVRLGE
jgi:hypothetical protein